MTDSPSLPEGGRSENGKSVTRDPNLLNVVEENDPLVSTVEDLAELACNEAVEQHPPRWWIRYACQNLDPPLVKKTIRLNPGMEIRATELHSALRQVYEGVDDRLPLEEEKVSKWMKLADLYRVGKSDGVLMKILRYALCQDHFCPPIADKICSLMHKRVRETGNPEYWEETVHHLLGLWCSEGLMWMVSHFPHGAPIGEGVWSRVEWRKGAVEEKYYSQICQWLGLDESGTLTRQTEEILPCGRKRLMTYRSYPVAKFRVVESNGEE